MTTARLETFPDGSSRSQRHCSSLPRQRDQLRDHRDQLGQSLCGPHAGRQGRPSVSLPEPARGQCVLPTPFPRVAPRALPD